MTHVPVIAETILKITPGAVLIRAESNDELWIPRSLIHADDHELLDEGEKDVEINVADWFAEQERL